jgi:hypothetical protein
VGDQRDDAIPSDDDGRRRHGAGIGGTSCDGPGHWTGCSLRRAIACRCLGFIPTGRSRRDLNRPTPAELAPDPQEVSISAVRLSWSAR